VKPGREDDNPLREIYIQASKKKGGTDLAQTDRVTPIPNVVLLQKNRNFFVYEKPPNNNKKSARKSKGEYVADLKFLKDNHGNVFSRDRL